ncbi:hypothetical protein ACWDXD_29630 [Streptomyces sp. NPDC003314]
MPSNAAEHARFLRITAVSATALTVGIGIDLAPRRAPDALLRFADSWCGVIALLAFTGAVV